MRRYWVAILFAWLSLWISLAYIGNHGWSDTGYELRGDWYYGYAETLLKDSKYQDCLPKPDSYHCATPLHDRAYRLPGYPVFLAGIMWVSPDHTVEMAKAFQAILVSVVTFMTVCLASRFGQGKAPLLFVGVMMLGARNIYYNVPLAQTETLFTFILAIFIQAFVKRRWRLAGLLWGATLLVRTSLIFSIPLLWLLMPRRHIMTFTAAMVVILIPWALRNAFVLHTFAPFGTNGGTVLKAGHNPESYQTGKHASPEDQADWGQFSGLGEVELDQALRKSALDYAKEHLADLPMATVKKWTIVTNTEVWLLLVIWAMAMVLKWRNHIPIKPYPLYGLCLVLFTGVLINAAVFFGQLRFRAPIDTLILLLIGLELWNVISLLKLSIEKDHIPISEPLR